MYSRYLYTTGQYAPSGIRPIYNIHTHYHYGIYDIMTSLILTGGLHLKNEKTMGFRLGLALAFQVLTHPYTLNDWDSA